MSLLVKDPNTIAQSISTERVRKAIVPSIAIKICQQYRCTYTNCRSYASHQHGSPRRCRRIEYHHGRRNRASFVWRCSSY
jgi:hypothetical protein